jgi:hypothetical protein
MKTDNFALTPTATDDGGDVGASVRWNFTRAYQDADTGEAVFVWRHTVGAGVMMRAPGTWKPSEHPGVFEPPVQMMEQLLGRNG